MMAKDVRLSPSTIILIIVISVVAGALASIVLEFFEGEPTQEDLIKEFYDVETAAHVSPHGIRKHMADDDSFILVDLRSHEEYVEEHITGAVNIPAYKDRDHSDYGAVERIRSEFQQLRAENPDKDIIVYCYSIPCMTGRKVGKIVADDGIYVKHLGVGWNEWRYDWESFNHPHEWDVTSPEDYVTSGEEPGMLDSSLVGTGCPIEGGLGC
jgi:rhodanese-related sulfurtransferase